MGQKVSGKTLFNNLQSIAVKHSGSLGNIEGEYNVADVSDENGKFSCGSSFKNRQQRYTNVLDATPDWLFVLYISSSECCVFI